MQILGIGLVDWLKVCAVLIAALGLFMNANQQMKLNSHKRIEVISDALWKLNDDEDLSQIYYQLEYHEFKYGSNFHGSDQEKKVDKLLSLFDILAKQYFSGHLDKKDIALISYEYLIIYQNSDIQNYFIFLEEWFKNKGIKNPPYQGFKKLGKIVESKFFNLGDTRLNSGNTRLNY
jgi:hypothetical protein